MFIARSCFSHITLSSNTVPQGVGIVSGGTSDDFASAVHPTRMITGSVALVTHDHERRRRWTSRTCGDSRTTEELFGVDIPTILNREGVERLVNRRTRGSFGVSSTAALRTTTRGMVPTVPRPWSTTSLDAVRPSAPSKAGRHCPTCTRPRAFFTRFQFPTS